MSEAPGLVSEYETEEKTELISFTTSEYASRLQGLFVQEEFNTTQLSGEVHLDELIVPPDKGIRLLVRPLRSRSVSPGSRESCEWVALRAEVAAAQDRLEESVLAVTQTAKDIKFVVRMPSESGGSAGPRIPSLWFELYYDPESDDQILLNNSDVPIVLSRVSQPPRDDSDGPGSPGTPGAHHPEYTINPGKSKALSPGTWCIHIGGTGVLDFRILERRRAVLRTTPPPLLPPPPIRLVQETSVPETPNSSGKRSFVADEDDEVGPGPRRQKTAECATAADKTKDTVAMFLRPATSDALVLVPSGSSTSKGKEVGRVVQTHPMLAMKQEETVVVPGIGSEADTYSVTKHEPIASTSLSTVFTGTMEHPSVPAGQVIIKVIKTRSQETESNVIQQADTWLREYKSHEFLRHENIVQLYGGDARHLSLYMEHVDGRDLGNKGMWRGNTDYFTGNRQDAARILGDIAGALKYLHGLGLVHNDIKPANILYSRERGAVLCDFGLSARVDQPATASGTPYYVPPEFIGRKLRGMPSDVWALGITMLYVLRKISFPDARGRHGARHLYWMIADINRAPARLGAAGGAAAGGRSAVAQMQQWLTEVNEAKERLNPEDAIERLTYEMLVPNQHQRITMKRVVAELAAA